METIGVHRTLVSIFVFVNLYLKESTKLLKRVPNQLIFISIQSEDTDYNNLSGKYYFHSVKNNAAAFMREEGQLENFDFQPYYLAFYNGTWFIQGTDSFENNRTEGWIYIDTKGLSYYKLLYYWSNRNKLLLITYFKRQTICASKTIGK